MSNKNKMQTNSSNKNDQLKTDAVARLANANKKTAKKVSDEELKKYQKPFLPWVPYWAKAAFIKWWFAGATCYFFLWGLGTVVGNQLDLLFVLWIALGIITDLMTNNVLRFIQQESEYEPFIMLPAKKYYTFFLNIVYAAPLLLGTIGIYELVNGLFINILSLPADSIVLGVEPVFFGMFYTSLDYIVLTIKNFIVKMIKTKTTK